MTDQQRLAVEGLFRAHAPGVARYALSRTGSAEAAEAITSRVFLKVVDCLGQCRGSLIAWMWAIARSEVALHFRARRPAEEIDEFRRDPGSGPAESAHSREMMLRLHEAIARLSEMQQQLVEMKFFLAMPNVEIAAALGLSPGNVGVMVHRAVRQLRELMNGCVEEPIHGRRAE